jgi:hypothetical protein
MQPILESIDKLADRLEKMETMLATLVHQKTVKDWYTTTEVAELLGKAEFTVREWCRLGRVNAEKRDCGRGNSLEWIISHDELTRIRNHGLLPVATKYRHYR